VLIAILCDVIHYYFMLSSMTLDWLWYRHFHVVLNWAVTDFSALILFVGCQGIQLLKLLLAEICKSFVTN